MPGTLSGGGVPRTIGVPVVRSFTVPPPQYPYALTGVTRNAAGAVLGNCAVVVYRSSDDSVAGRSVSDASGNYRISASPSLSHYVVAYLVGSPDVGGTSSNQLTGV